MEEVAEKIFFEEATCVGGKSLCELTRDAGLYEVL